MVIGFEEFLVGLLVLFLVGLRLQVCFFQFFSEKNLKNFGRGVLKMVIGFEEFPVGLLVLMLVGLRVSYRFASSNFFQKKI